MKSLEFQNEKEFKRVIGEILRANKINFLREVYVGNRSGGVYTAKDGNSAYIDFICDGPIKFFIEAKNCVSGAEMARALGQCLLYKEFVPSRTPFILIPYFLSLEPSVGLWSKVCQKNGIILTTEEQMMWVISKIAPKNSETKHELTTSSIS